MENIISVQIKKLRLAKNLSQYELGKHLGVSTKTVDLWERGLQKPRFDTLIKMVYFFKVKAGYILGAED